MSAEILRRAAAEMRQDDQGPVILAVADWLDAVADNWRESQYGYWSDGALAVANAYLGETRSVPDPEFGRVVSKVVVIRCVVESGDLVDRVVTEDPEGDPLPLTEALGMLRLAEDSIIRSRMDSDDEGTWL